jgi:thiol:disulfide interchange protein DsbC
VNKSATLLARGWLIALLAVVCAGGAYSETGASDAGAEGGKKLAARLQALRPGIPIEKVSATPVPGIYALDIGGGTVFYGTEDGRYLFAGDMYELGESELVNLAEAGRVTRRQALMAEVAVDDMIVFSAKGKRKAVISVFTDVDCGYCQKLHLEVPELNAMGIEVRYLAYPRAGINSQSYQKIVSAWCSDDPNGAITRLKARQTSPNSSCDNPVAAQFDLGRELGVTGTPAIVLEDGRLLPGYMPAAKLAETVGILPAAVTGT